MEEKKETQIDFVIAWVDGGDVYKRQSAEYPVYATQKLA